MSSSNSSRIAAKQPGATAQVLGWNEAFVGIETEDPEAYARQVRAAVLERMRLHCSVGIGDILVRAKVATGFGKPAGQGAVGVGTKVSGRLANLGINTVAKLAGCDPQDLVPEFGPRMGPWYAQRDPTSTAMVDDAVRELTAHVSRTSWPMEGR